MRKVLDPLNIHIEAFWSKDLNNVEKMIRKLDANSLKKLYGMTISITDRPLFPHPVTDEQMAGLTRSGPTGKPYLIILGSEPTPRIVYHEVAHSIGIDDEKEAQEFATQREMQYYGMQKEK